MGRRKRKRNRVCFFGIPYFCLFIYKYRGKHITNKSNRVQYTLKRKSMEFMFILVNRYNYP